MNEQEWQKVPCYRCDVRHPWHCPDCWGGGPTCADHVCTWPDECPATISGMGETIACVLDPGHDGDHGRGFLRWDDNGEWYTQRWRRDDGTWHGLKSNTSTMNGSLTTQSGDDGGNPVRT